MELETKIEKVEVSKEIEEELRRGEIEETTEYTENYLKLRREAKIRSRQEFIGDYHN
ncbi:MAG: hypothetical protein PHQ66_01450 [Candidatus Nanoarchaeia archaeon]|nr:hypothetical protein [Candidatus Nanoarchaeia archaeon]MDD5357958.1 hypothetical protein [Candidatus Nanoarchaeia archaeon]MDD5588877.1 hypothetical protein [Candidatus Nanoarchaeia archaeon]